MQSRSSHDHDATSSVFDVFLWTPLSVFLLRGGLASCLTSRRLSARSILAPNAKKLKCCVFCWDTTNRWLWRDWFCRRSKLVPKIWQMSLKSAVSDAALRCFTFWLVLYWSNVWEEEERSCQFNSTVYAVPMLEGRKLPMISIWVFRRTGPMHCEP